MPRFFIDKSQIEDSSLLILGDDARHIARSLRMAVGDEVTVSDGEGNEYFCKLTKIRDERCDLVIEEQRHSKSEPKSEISLSNGVRILSAASINLTFFPRCKKASAHSTPIYPPPTITTFFTDFCCAYLRR